MNDMIRRAFNENNPKPRSKCTRMTVTRAPELAAALKLPEKEESEDLTTWRQNRNAAKRERRERKATRTRSCSSVATSSTTPHESGS